MTESHNIKNAWRRIESAIASVVPSVTNKFSPGASLEELIDLESKMSMKLPDSLRDLLLLQNGNPSNLDEILVNSPFLSVNGIFKTWELATDVNGDDDKDVDDLSQCGWWHRRLIPITGADGDSVCIDSLTGRLHEHVHDAGIESSHCESLERWLTGIAQRIENCQFEIDDGYLILNDHGSEIDQLDHSTVT